MPTVLFEKMMRSFFSPRFAKTARIMNAAPMTTAATALIIDPDTSAGGMLLMIPAVSIIVIPLPRPLVLRSSTHHEQNAEPQATVSVTIPAPSQKLILESMRECVPRQYKTAKIISITTEQ